jgi:hypothetical protein
MKKLLLAVLSTGLLFGQATETATPVPADQPAVSGYIDLGYRWQTGVHGSFNTYRSIVDLGSGPKLLGAEFTILNSVVPVGSRFFDRINVRLTDIGDEPYETYHIDFGKAKLYNFTGDYRNIAYYNNLPAYADPLLGSGIILDEQAMDIRKKLADFHLDLFPNHTFMPYLGYDHASDDGYGVANFVANANEYPVFNRIRNSTENYRGGLRIELPKWHFKLEQGGLTFKDDEQLSQSGGTNFGNLNTPFFGQTLSLTSLIEAYAVRSHGYYTDASFGANPFSWVDLYGTFLYSQPVSGVNFVGANTGNNVILSQLLFYTSEVNFISGAAKAPHTSGNFGAEIRPIRRVRLVPSWLTDRLHTSGSNTGVDTLTTTTNGQVSAASLLSSRLVSNSSEAGMQVFLDVTSKLTLRGGYKYVWGDASNVILPLDGLTGFETGKIRRTVGLAGLAWRPIQNLWVNIDVETGGSGSTYYRTSLYDYTKTSVRGRYRLRRDLNLAVSDLVLSNVNPNPGINYSFLAHSISASLQYLPNAGKVWDFEGSYTRSTVYSNIFYLEPSVLTPALSRYRDNNHTVTALFNFNIPSWVIGFKSRITAGGTALMSSGSNPTVFYQPLARLSIPVYKGLAWNSEVRYYGFGEQFYLFQGFRTYTVTTGVRITR